MAPPGRPELSFSALPPHQPPADLPPLSALFLVDFDVKAGYTIAWKQAEPGIELEGAVEYKSLPSGLHTVTDDLIYFVHAGTHAGLSAFANQPCDEEEARNARMIAVGILVPLSYGRLGRAWRHAGALKSLATKLAKDRDSIDSLETYWQEHKDSRRDGDNAELRPPTGETPLSSPSITFSTPSSSKALKTHSRKRSASDGTMLNQATQKLSPYHPAWSLAALLDKFGPLIFPIYRAALLRKRILISCHAPVREVCDFVYNISVLSNVPLSVGDILPASSSTLRLRPLFAIGVHDIGFLMEDLEASKRGDHSGKDDNESGWIACTTDSILAMKDTLWDMLITMPPDYSTQAKDKSWPLVECPRGNPIKATQRDLRRFHALRNGLAKLVAQRPDSPGQPPSEMGRSSRFVKDDSEVEKLVEPLSWTALAYNGFMWWASAGEQLRSEEQEEAARDAALLADMGPTSHAPMAMPRSSSQPDLVDSIASLANRRATGSEEAGLELAIIAYFHRLTTQTLSTLGDITDSADEQYTDEEETDGDAQDGAEGDDLLRRRDSSEASFVTIDSRSVESLGLDVWSANDAVFIQEMVETYFGRTARVEGKGVEVCGIRVC